MRGKTISGTTAVLLLAFFFLPWFSVSLQGRVLGQFSGYQLATGVGAYALDGLNGRSSLFLIPLAGLFILVCVLAAHLRPDWQSAAALGVAAAALTGLLWLLWLWRVPQSALLFSPEVGMWLSLFAFIAAAVGGGLMWQEAKKKEAMVTQKQMQNDISLEQTVLAKTAVLRKIENDPQEKTTLAPAITGSLYKIGVSADDPSIQVRLVVQSGDFTGAQFRLMPPARIGRDAGNDIVIEDSAMSGFHAVVRQHGGAFHLQDLNSTNGIYLENQTTHRWQRVPAVTLVHDMRLKLGRTIFQVVVEE